MTDAHCHVAAPGTTRRFICPLSDVQFAELHPRETVACGRISAKCATETPFSRGRISAKCAAENDIVFWGVHPWFLDGPRTVLTVRTELLADSRAGVGEIGLDRLRDRTISQAMRDTFVAQLRLAVELRRPVVLHGAKCWGQVVATIRQVYASLGLSSLVLNRGCNSVNCTGGKDNSLVSAHFTEMRPRESGFDSPPPLLFHGFSRSDGLLPDIVALNGYVSVGPAVLNDHAVNYRALVAKIPADRLLLETDATEETVSSVPPLADIARKVAEIRGVDVDSLVATVEANADRFAAPNC